MMNQIMLGEQRGDCSLSSWGLTSRFIKSFSLIALSVLVFSASVFAVEPYEGTWRGKTSGSGNVEVFVRNTTISITLTYKIFTASGTTEGTVTQTGSLLDGLGTFDNAADKWTGDYKIEGSGVSVESGTWEASRIPFISSTPSAFENLDEILSFKSPISFLKTALYAGGYFWFVDSFSDEKINQVDSEGNLVNSFSPSATTSLSASAFDGSYLWFAGNEGGFNNKIYKVDLSGNLVSTHNFSGSFAPNNMTFGNDRLWATDNFGKLYELDTTGNQLNSYSLSLNSLKGLIFDRTSLWAVTSDKKLVKITTSGTIENSYPLSDDPEGLTFDGTHLWVSLSSGGISKIDLSGNLIAFYKDSKSGNLAFDGTNLWVIGSNVYKLHEDVATPEPGASETRTFTVTNDGSAILAINNFSITGTDSADFTLSNNTCANKSLNTFDNCTLDVKFQPTTPAFKKATLEIASNDPETSTLNIPLSGGKPDDTPPSVFTGGIAINGGDRQQSATLNLSDSVEVSGNIIVEPAHIGQSVDLFVYAETTIPDMSDTLYFMLKSEPDLEILDWDQNPATLVAFQSNVTLTAEHFVAIYKGHFIYPGTLKVYFGYRLTDGTLFKNEQPIDIVINE